jgi:hypothetical protein
MAQVHAAYHAVARPWAKGWELIIYTADPGKVQHKIGATRSRTLDGAEFMVRDYVSLLHDVPKDSFDVAVRGELGGWAIGEDSTRELAALERRWRGRTARLLGALRGPAR